MLSFRKIFYQNKKISLFTGNTEKIITDRIKG